VSAETKEALARAIREHVADERPGAYVPAFVVVAEYTSIELEQADATAAIVVAADGQSWATSVGLAQAGSNAFRPAVSAFLVD
jgi:hypothetical protein